VTAEQVLSRLRSLGSPHNRAGMARYGINVERALGISVTTLRRLAREIGHDHLLALRLWDSGVHEARVLACLIEEPREVSPEQMDRWTAGFASWDVCDLCCNTLFRHLQWAWDRTSVYSAAEPEFAKRAGFTLMAVLAVHDKQAPDDRFEQLLETIRRESADERNYVRKAVNWALRQIGKRNLRLNRAAVALASSLAASDSPAARWIGRDALRELTSPAVQARLEGREGPAATRE
jgi:3-methyladenine DNA glycosylase AlkD